MEREKVKGYLFVFVIIVKIGFLQKTRCLNPPRTARKVETFIKECQDEVKNKLVQGNLSLQKVKTSSVSLINPIKSSTIDIKIYYIIIYEMDQVVTGKIY